MLCERGFKLEKKVGLVLKIPHKKIPVIFLLRVISEEAKLVFPRLDTSSFSLISDRESSS